MSAPPTRQEFDDLRAQLREERRENAALHAAIRERVDREHWPAIVTNTRRLDEREVRGDDDDGVSASLGALGSLIRAVSEGRIWSYLVVGPMLVVLLYALSLVIAAPFGHARGIIDATLGGVARIAEAVTTKTVEVEGAVTLEARADSLIIPTDSLDLP